MVRVFGVLGLAVVLAACSGGTIRHVDGGAGTGGATGAAGVGGVGGGATGGGGTGGGAAGTTGGGGASGGTGGGGGGGAAGSTAGTTGGGGAAGLDASAGAAGSDAGVDASVDVAKDVAGEAPDASDGASADAEAGAVSDAPAKVVTVSFTGQVVTVASAPFGFDSTARLEPVAGSFSYDLRMMDQQLADPLRGTFEGFGLTTFTFTVKGHTITGSGRAQPQTENLSADTFRFRDGKLLDQIERTMSFDGTPSTAIKLFIAISDGTGAMLTSDALPDPFPTIDIKTTPHTFSLEDAGGTLLMQLDTLTPH